MKPIRRAVRVTVFALPQFTTGSTTLGPEINWQDLHNSTIGGAVSRPGKTTESIAAFQFWAKRSFILAGNPFNVRVGFDYSEQLSGWVAVCSRSARATPPRHARMWR